MSEIDDRCNTCRSEDVGTPCQLCEQALCEDCVLTPPLHTFSLMEKTPEELKHVIYCRFCFDDKIEP
ncbi:MAG: hypothetical protein EOP09_05090, partial [Proteobacteria bacterium]